MAATVFLGLMLVALLHLGYATTPARLNREQGIYRASTNAVSGVQSLVPFMPAPVATPVEVILGIASAALKASNLHHQKFIRQLKTGNGHRHGKPNRISPPTAQGVSAKPASIPINYQLSTIN